MKVKVKLAHMYVKVLCQGSLCANMIEICQGIKKLLPMLKFWPDDRRRTPMTDGQPGYDNSSILSSKSLAKNEFLYFTVRVSDYCDTIITFRGGLFLCILRFITA